MKTTVEPHDQHATLHLRGEFDTFSCPAFQEEIATLQRSGQTNIVVNLRLVRFINSTALGAILKASRSLQEAGGKLLISHPSSFCRDILEKIGLDRVIGVHNSDEEAGAAFASGTKPPVADDNEHDFEADPSSVLFRPTDQSRVEHFLGTPKAENTVHGHAFGQQWTGVGRMISLDLAGLAYKWSGGKTGLAAFDMGQLLAVGTTLTVKFKLPLLKKGFSEAAAEITELTERSDSVEVRVTFSDLDKDTTEAVRQYMADMSYLKDELKRATN
mgnify:FL=1|jgi:anti-anti-sigma factor